MPQVKTLQIKTALLLLFLVAGVLFQVGRSAKEIGSGLLSVYKVIGQPSIWRGANFTAGVNFANYVSFLIENIPEKATVVIPPTGVGPMALSRTPYMQFFLAPREVVNCTSLDSQCPADLAASGAYVLVNTEAGFPGDQVIKQPERLRMFNDTWGVYPPENAGGGQPLRAFASLLEMAKLTIWPVVWLAFIALAGLGLIHSLLPTLRLTSKLALGYGISLGGISLAICTVSLLGASWNRLMLFVVTLGWGLLGGGMYYRARRKSSSLQTRTASHPQHPIDVWHGILLFIAATATILAVGHGFYASDEVVLWGVKGYGIAVRGLVEGASQWGTRTMSYPLNVPLNIGIFKTLFAELLPASKIIFPLFFLSLLVLLYDHLSERMPIHQAGLATLLLATAPILFRHATIGYANLPLTYYLLATVVLLHRAFTDDSGAEQNMTFLLVGSFLALSAWTRPEGLLLSWLLAGLTIAWTIFIAKRPKPVQAAIALLVPLLLYTAFWAVASKAIYPPTGRNSELVSTAVQQLTQGNLHLTELAYILRYFITQVFTLTTWGVVGFGLLLLPWLGTRTSAAQRTAWIFTSIAGLICVLLILGIYQLASYDPGRDISWWVSTGLDRMMLPGIVLLWLGITSRLGVSHGQRG